MARAGLKKVVKTVKGKKRSVRRAYWVKSQADQPKKGFLRRNAGKLLGAAALAAGAYMAYKGGRGVAAEVHHQLKGTASRQASHEAISQGLRGLNPLHALRISPSAREEDRAAAERHAASLRQHFGTTTPTFAIPPPRQGRIQSILSDVKEGMRSGITGQDFRSADQRHYERHSTPEQRQQHRQQAERRATINSLWSGSHTERGGADSGHTDSSMHYRLGGTVGEPKSKRPPFSQRRRLHSLSIAD